MFPDPVDTFPATVRLWLATLPATTRTSPAPVAVAPLRMRAESQSTRNAPPLPAVRVAVPVVLWLRVWMARASVPIDPLPDVAKVKLYPQMADVAAVPPLASPRYAVDWAGPT